MLIQTDLLSKRYGQLAALTDCTFDVPRGEILGLLGPNGAGKTTLLRLLLGYLKPTSGRASIGGLDCYAQSLAVHRQLAYLARRRAAISPAERSPNAAFFARLRHASFQRSIRLAERLQLDLTRRVRQMSTGMRQKLALAVTLTPDVPLVILDEPTANLDPTVRRDVVELIREARGEGKTVLFSSHVLSEVEDACDRVLVLKAGRLVDAVRVVDVRRQHRIQAALTGPLSPVPAPLADDMSFNKTLAGLTLISRGELAPLLGWLANQPLAKLQIEPIGLRSVYERHHPAANGDE